MLKFNGGGIIELLQTDKTDSEEREIFLVGFHHFCLGITNLDEFLKEIPVEYIYDSIKIGRTDLIRQIMLQDPDGNKIELHELQ
jgi:hypothetical protein